MLSEYHTVAGEIMYLQATHDVNTTVRQKPQPHRDVTSHSARP